jgi:CBS domain-containing protein
VVVGVVVVVVEGGHQRTALVPVVGGEGLTGVVGEGDLQRVLLTVIAKALVVMVAVVVLVVVMVLVGGVHLAAVVVVVMVVAEGLVTVTTEERVTTTSTRHLVATAETPLARAQGVSGVAEVTPQLHHHDTSVTPL